MTPNKPKKLIKTRFKENLTKKRSHLNTSNNSPTKNQDKSEIILKSRNGAELLHTSTSNLSKSSILKSKASSNRFNVRYGTLTKLYRKKPLNVTPSKDNKSGMTKRALNNNQPNCAYRSFMNNSGYYTTKNEQKGESKNNSMIVDDSNHLNVRPEMFIFRNQCVVTIKRV